MFRSILNFSLCSFLHRWTSVVLTVMSLTPREGDVCRKHRAAGGVHPALLWPRGWQWSQCNIAGSCCSWQDGPQDSSFLSSGLGFKRYFLTKRVVLQGIRWESHNIKQAGRLVIYLKKSNFSFCYSEFCGWLSTHLVYLQVMKGGILAS